MSSLVHTGSLFARLTERSRKVLPDVMRLSKPLRGSFSSFALKPEKPLRCGTGQVRIATDAVGLNFRDVLIALNKYPDMTTPLGVEFVGRIIEPDPTNRHLKEGQRVLGVMLASMADQLVLPSRAIATFPDHMSPSVAAGLPVAYLTAWRGLVEMANLRPNQTVLVHSGTGGVGMAAVHLSHRIGAKVISTAGSTAKRAHLRKMSVPHAFGSRDVGFVDDVLDVTNGRGVDLVIGALPPALARANLKTIAYGGHFVDMGKLSKLEQADIKAIRPDIRYSVMTLDTDAIENPDWVGRTLRTLSAEISTGALPPLPITQFSVSDADKAFRYLAKAQHMGKVVLRFPPKY